MAGNDIRITLVTIDKTKAAIIRATFNPEKLIDFANDPAVRHLAEQRPKQ